MLCPNCGAENKDGSKFCKVCGVSLNSKTVGADNSAQKNQTTINENNYSNNGSNKGSNNGNNKSVLIISITVIICVLIIAGVFVYLNTHDNGGYETVSGSASVSQDSVSSSSSSDSSSSGDSPKSSTINSGGYTYNVQGVDFVVPSSGYMRTSKALRFTYLGHNCEVERVPQYESSSYNWDLNTLTLSQDYQGGLGYSLVVNNHPWMGIKVYKGGNWYHISMNTDDPSQAEALLSWMNSHNTWEAP